ncbi:MAG: translation initiation factor IF-2 [Gemmatimonadota bacterium]
MAKLRVYELAREFEVKTEELIQLLREMELPVRSHMSSLDDGQVARIRTRLERDKRRPDSASKDEAGGRRRRRRRVVETPIEPTLPVGEPDEAAEIVEEPPAELVASARVDSPADWRATAIEEKAAKLFKDLPSEPPVEVEGKGDMEAPAPPIDPFAETPVTLEPTSVETEPLKPVIRKDEIAARTKEAPPAASAEQRQTGTVRIQAEGYTLDGHRRRRGRKKKRTRVDQDAVQENIKKTLAKMDSGSGTTKRRRRASAEDRELAEAEVQRLAEEERLTVRVAEFLTVAELANLMQVPAGEIITSAFKNLGLMVTINQRLDFDQIELITEEFGFNTAREEEYGAELVGEVEPIDPSQLVPRPPVVTVMGHVDHGKTSLLDQIRKTNVIAGEAGGITQHIGAYHVVVNGGRSISFLDTPGHAAFTAMRARGADLTDIVILVVAADDGVMPQTEEAISHAKNAGKPIVVAVNKIDLPAANPTKVKQELLEHEVVVEEFGGEVLSSEISAKSGEGMDDLLEKVLLQAELLELRADPNQPARGTVVEAELDKGMGAVATVLITDGTLRVGDGFVAGVYSGRVRALLDERGNTVTSAGPGTPVRVLGFEGVAQAGESMIVLDYERAREITAKRQQIERERDIRRKSKAVRLEDVFEQLQAGASAQLNLIMKGDTDGSVQALSDELERLSTDEVEVKVIHRGVGAVNGSDVLLAQATGAIIIGFHVRPEPKARALAEREGVDIRTYRVIYEAAEEVRSALEGLLAPEEREVILGAADIRELFKVPKVGTVAGCYVTEGVIGRNARIRVLREHVVVYEGKLASLRRFKDDVKEVKSGFECGMAVENYNDVKVGDVLESFTIEHVARTLGEPVTAPAGAAGDRGESSEDT